MLASSGEGSQGRFWAIVFTHITNLEVMYRNRRGKERRYYTDFDVPHGTELPCGCNPQVGGSHRFRLFQDGDLVHHKCSKVFISPDKQQMLQRDLWTQNIILKVVSKPKKRSDEPRVPYRSNAWFF